MEVDNAVHGVEREIKQRYDLKGTKCEIERTDNTLTITADDTTKLSEIEELLRKYLVRRQVDQRSFEFNPTQDASGGSIKRTISIKQGIEGELARKIMKEVRGAKTKVQTAIQGTELHFTGKNRDDLQKTIAFIKEMDIQVPLQYVNFRN
jgi:uncharacterized protein YajQ (UPF0234 family)